MEESVDSCHDKGDSFCFWNRLHRLINFSSKKIVTFSLGLLLFSGMTFAQNLPEEMSLFPNTYSAALSPNLFQDTVNLQNPADKAISYNDAHVQLHLQYSDLFGYVLNSKFTGKLGGETALALEWDYGDEEKRFNGTWGILLTPRQLLKLTGEYLNQQLPFNFDSGAIQKRIPQFAYGGEYKYIFPQSRISAIDLGAYYADARSYFLPSIIYINQGGEYINYRHIAGARSDGGSVGLDLQPWKTGLIDLKLNYDQVHYNQVYRLKDTPVNNNGVGATLDFQQLLLSNVKFDISGSKREIYDDYNAGIFWLLPMPPGNRLEIGMSAERTISHNSTPNEDSYFLKLNYDWEDSEQKLTKYALPVAAEDNDVAAWVQTPAVHMDRVLATVDQLTKKIPLGIFDLVPDLGPSAGGTFVTLIGQGFVPGALLVFGGTTAIGTTVIDDHTITAFVPPESIALKGSPFVNVTLKNPDSSVASLPDGYEYTDAPQPATANPNHGSTAGGTAVTITGTKLLRTTEVQFGGIAATDLTIISDSEITCKTPAHIVGAVDVVLTNPSGIGTLVNGFTFLDVPHPTSVSPNSGSPVGNETVTIHGNGFTGTTAITFGSVPATDIVVINDMEVTCKTPAHALGTVNVVVTNPVGIGTLVDGFSYTVTPHPNLAVPNFGSTAGGNEVTIQGNNLTGTTAITFGGTPATNIIVVSDTEVTCEAPAHTAGIVNIVLTSPDGSGTLTNGYTYLNVPAPTTATPNFGSTAGGNEVTLHGNGFVGTTGITFGGTPATNIIVVSDTEVTCQAPAHVVGLVNIVVTNSLGSGTLTNGYTYLDTPSPASATPNEGSSAGDQLVTLSGTGFTGTTSVTFGGNPATDITVVSDTELTCKTPAHTAGTVNIIVTNPLGSGTLTNGYTYFNPPNPTTITPDFGPTAGETFVTIHGTGFTGVSSVTFGGAPANNISVISDTEITCDTPAHDLGAVDVEVTNPGGTGTLIHGFTYLGVPDPTSVDPNGGSIIGGNTVTIDGVDFLGTTAVTFGGIPATNIIMLNDTQLTCQVPPHPLGPVTIVVTNPLGSGSLPNGYRYLNAPNPISVTPNSGTVAGGNNVTIDGSGFTETSSITFNGIPSPSFTVISDNEIRCKPPAHAAGSVNVVVTNPAGSGTILNGYTYLNVPSPTLVTPGTGTTAGNTLVTITGTGFTGTTNITFGGAPANTIIVINDTTITCRTPAHALGNVNVIVRNPAGSGTLTNGYRYI